MRRRRGHDRRIPNFEGRPDEQRQVIQKESIIGIEAYLVVAGDLDALMRTAVKTSQTAADKPLAVQNRSHSRQQFTSIRLDDIGICTCAQGLFGNLSGAVLAYEDDFGRGGNFPDSASGFDPIQRRQSDVEQDQVWLQFFCFSNRLQPVRRFAYDV